HEHLAVADLAGARGAVDRLERRFEGLVGYGGLDLELGQEIHDVLGAAVQLGMALLPAEALDLGDGQSVHARFGERFAHLVELERADDGDDQFHAVLLLQVGAQNDLDSDTSTVSSTPARSVSCHSSPMPKPFSKLLPPVSFQ